MVTTELDNRGATSYPLAAAASGVWSISARGTSEATLAINIFVAGSHHASFGGPVAQTTSPVRLSPSRPRHC